MSNEELRRWAVEQIIRDRDARAVLDWEPHIKAIISEAVWLEDYVLQGGRRTLAEMEAAMEGGKSVEGEPLQ